MLRTLLYSLLGIGILACSSRLLDAEEAGGTEPVDGAPGVCCEPKNAGGSGYAGGYIERGTCKDTYWLDSCPTGRIVDDVHGCKRLEFQDQSICRRLPDAGIAPAPDASVEADAAMDAGSDADAS